MRDSTDRDRSESRHRRPALWREGPSRGLATAAPVRDTDGMALDVGSVVLGADDAPPGDQLECWSTAGSVETTTWLAIVDPSGHGVAARDLGRRVVAALREAALREAGGGEAAGQGSAAAVLAATADRLGDTGEHFATVFVAQIDVAARQCHFANGGHPPPLLLSAEGVHPLGPTGPLLGPFPGSWATRTVAFRPGDALLLYSDGITETAWPDGYRLGLDRLVRAFRAAERRAADAHQTVRDTLRSLHLACPHPPKDDCTLCLARFAAVAPGTISRTAQEAAL